MNRLESGAHVPAHLLPQWQQSSLDDRVHAVMTPHVWSAPGEEREFKRTAALQVVSAMAHFDQHVLPTLNAGFGGWHMPRYGPELPEL